MKLFVLILLCSFEFGKVTPMRPQTMGETSQKMMAIEENSQDSDSDYATANESDSSEQLADNSSSVEDEPLNVPPISNPKKQRVVTFNLVPSTESPPAQWDRLFIRQEMPKIKWLCPDNSQNAMCQNARFANRTLRKYLEYQNAAITISNAPTNDKYKKENHEKSIDKDNLLKRLALKPSFLKLSPALNNLLSVKITLLKAYKRFNLNESSDIKQLEKITGNFSNMENCGKVLKLVKAFKRGVNELESKKVKSDKIRKLVKKLKKYRRALESIKVEMELDSGYCKECKILTIDEILKTSSATKKVEQLISQTKMLRKNFAKFVKHN